MQIKRFLSVFAAIVAVANAAAVSSTSTAAVASTASATTSATTSATASLAATSGSSTSGTSTASSTASATSYTVSSTIYANSTGAIVSVHPNMFLIAVPIALCVLVCIIFPFVYCHIPSRKDKLARIESRAAGKQPQKQHRSGLFHRARADPEKAIEADQESLPEQGRDSME